MPLAREIILPVRIDDGEGGRQGLVRLVMVDDDDVCTSRVGGGDGRMRGRAAVDGEDEAGSLLCESREGRFRRAVAFGEAVGDVGRARLAMGAQEALDQGGRGRAVHVVITEHGDRLSSPDRVCEPLGGARHVLQAAGIGQQGPQRRIEIALHRLQVGPAGGKHAAEQIRQSVSLGDGGCGHGPPWNEALDPAAAARRAFHAEKSGARVVWIVFEGGGHGTRIYRDSECN